MTSHCSEADPASGESTDEIGAVKTGLAYRAETWMSDLGYEGRGADEVKGR